MKIDVTTIPGYAEMTAEQKVQALESYEAVDNSAKLKSALDKASAEASEWKRQFREKQTEQERLEAERAEAEQTLKNEVETLRKEKAVQGYTAEYLAVGYGADLARATAQAMVDGDNATVFANLKSFITEHTKAVEASALNKQPELSAGTSPSSEIVQQQELDKIRHYFGLK